MVATVQEQNPKTRVDALQLALSHLDYLMQQIKDTLPQLNELSAESEELRQLTRTKLFEAAMSFKGAKSIKPELIDDFLKEPYSISLEPVKGRRDAYYLHVPRFYDHPFGYLARQTIGYNTFIVTRIMDYFGEIPQQLKQTLGWKEPLDVKLDKGILRGSKSAIEEAWKRYKPFLKSQDKEGLHIQPRYTFELLASLIDDGILPFTPQPIDPNDFVERKFVFTDDEGHTIEGDRVLRPYQRDAWKRLREHGHIGVYYPASTGKTVISLYAMTHLKPPHLVLVPSRLLIDQWNARISEHTDLKVGEEVLLTTYQTGIKHYMKKNWTLVVTDETHHTPANEFVKMSLIQRKYTLGLSATPYREDGREAYVVAFSGFPVGLSWQYFRDLNLIKSPVCNVWLLKDMNAKIRKIQEMLSEDKKTIIFSDHIELGKTIASRFKLPFVHGGTKENRFKVLQDNQVTVASRVADEGISIPEIQRVIELDWLGSSRRQELQRFTRLLHGFASKEKGEHHILMTLGEYERDKNRLFSVMDKGFKVEIHREGVSERAMTRVASEVRPRPVNKHQGTVSVTTEVSLPPVSADISRRLPGITKTLERLTAVERAVAQTILANPGHPYSSNALTLATGYGANTIMNQAHLGKLVKMGLIRPKGKGEYESAI